MKKLINLIIIIALSIISISADAQDLITKKDGTDIPAKILEITITEVKYKKFENLSGPTYTLLKSDILMVRYENGTNDVFNEPVKKDKIALVDDDMYALGKQDANMYYPVKHTGAGWTLVTAALTDPLLGLIPAISCSKRIPKDYNLNYPDNELMKNADYNKSYKEQALKMKKKKIWKMFGIGSGIYTVALTYNLIRIFAH